MQTSPACTRTLLPVKSGTVVIVLATLLATACDAAEDVRTQALPALAGSSVEARLGLPELEGPWRFAGWELAQGDTLGLEAELPVLGVLLLQVQKRDSLAGLYVMGGGGRAPLSGEIRRDSVVSLVTFLQPDDGRFVVGMLSGDTLWVESTTLLEPDVWREDSRAAFVRSRVALAPFTRVRGQLASVPQADSATLATQMDSLGRPVTPGALPGEGPPPSATDAGAVTPSGAAQPTLPTQTRPALPVRPPVSQPTRQGAPPVEAEVEAEPAPEPVAEERDPPHILGVPVNRDTAGDGQLP